MSEENKNNNRMILAGVVISFLLAAFLWTTIKILSPILIGGLLLFFLFGLKEYPLAGRLRIGIILILLLWIFIRAQSVLFPFLFSFAIAYLFDPLADRLEKWGIRRSLGVAFLILLTLSVLILSGTFLIPSLSEEIQEFIKKTPALAKSIAGFIQKNLPRLVGFLNIDIKDFQQNLLEKLPATAEQILLNILKGITGVGALLGRILNIVLIPILTFYFLKDYDRIKDWILKLSPRKYRSSTYFYLWRLNRILGGYYRGQIIICIIVGFLTGTGMALFGIPFAILLGFITGLLNIIPFIGFYISLIVSLLAGFLTPSPFVGMLKIAGVFLSVQMLEAYILSPRILGRRVGLHPIAVIFSIFIFSRFLGFWGLIIGVPSAALIKFLIDESKRREKWNEIYTEKYTIENKKRKQK
jgi:predicted PurR-regulated permease PerM